MPQREGVHIITSGTSATINNGAGSVFVDLASLAATFTLTMPSTPADHDVVMVMAGGTIGTGTPVVTALTMSANSGQAFVGTLFTGLAGGDSIGFQWRADNSKWYRIK